MLRLTTILLLTIMFSLTGCTSSNIKLKNYADQHYRFKNGDIRLTCRLSCAVSQGKNNYKIKQLYKNQQWKDLAAIVSSIGFQSDHTYYYLGRSAEELGFYDAAQTYYHLSKQSYKCDGFVNNCDGLVVPVLVNKHLNKLKLEAREKLEAKAKKAKSWSDIEWNTVSVSDLQTKINAGVGVNKAIGEYDSSPLQMAVINNENLEVIKFLIANGADVNYKNKNNATVVYFSAAFNKNPAITTLLIDKGADVNIKDNNKVSALSYAAEKRQSLEIINILIAAGANVNSRDVDGETPLHNAAEKSQSLEIINALIAAGANVNLKGSDGETPLHNAALKYKDIKVISVLISAGSDINAKTNNGETILYWAIRGNNLEVVKFLIAKGADINAKTNNGSTPLYLAIRNESEIIKFIASSGIDINIQKIYLYASKLERKVVSEYESDTVIDIDNIIDKAKFTFDVRRSNIDLFKTGITYGAEIFYRYIIENFPNDDLAIKANDRLTSLTERMEQRLQQATDAYYNSQIEQHQIDDTKYKIQRRLQTLKAEAEQQRKQDLLDAGRIRKQDIKNAEDKRKEDLQQRKNSCIVSHNQCVKGCGRLYVGYGETCNRDCLLRRRNSCNNNCYQIAKSSGCT